MSALGSREWVGLALLLVAGFIAATFLDAGAHDNLPPRTPVLGQPLDTPTIEPVPTATLPPPVDVEIPEGSWLVSYYDGDTQDPYVVNFVETLDLRFDNAPFGDFRDDDWHLEARAELQLQPGQQTFTIIHDGAIRVVINGEQVAADGDPADGERSLTVLFPSEGGSTTITVIASDRSGPLVVRWQ